MEHMRLPVLTAQNPQGRVCSSTVLHLRGLRRKEVNTFLEVVLLASWGAEFNPSRLAPEPT